MNKGIETAVQRLLDWLYPERQIILRCRGKVTFVALGKKGQLGLSLLGLSLVSWLSYASVGIYLQQDVIASKDNHIARMVGDHDRLSADMHAVEKKYRKITANLESNQKLLGNVLRQRDSVDRIRKKLLHQLGQTKKQRDLALNKSEAQNARLAGLKANLRRTLDQSDNLQLNLNSVANRLTKTASDRDRIRQERKALAQQLDIMRNDIFGLRKARQGLSQNLQSSEQMVDRLTYERDKAISTNKVLNKHIASLEDRLELLHQSQRTLVENIHNRTDSKISELESLIKLTGLDLNRLLKRVDHKRLAVGGPLLATNDKNQSAGELTLLENRLTRWSALNALLERLPITPPVDAYYISSRYGKRRDPFTKRMAFHGGVDLGGVPRSRVFTTSPGIVTFVGWKGPYGRMVEVDHGLGLRTRYGHLRKILVKHRQRVTFRHKIGLMGSSGRSTGAHVHYEVLFDGKPVDPMKFLKAGKYVFKG